MAASRTSLLSLLSISHFFLHQTGAVTEFGDFDTLARTATLLYKSYDPRSFENHRGYHVFYPSMNFTCSGNITKVSYITYGSIVNWLRFATWTPAVNFAQDESRYKRKNYTNAGQSVEVNVSNSYHLYELTLNRASWMRFDAGDVFGIRLPWFSWYSRSSNPLHQRRGGFNRFTQISEGNNQSMEFDISSESFRTGHNFPLVSLQTDVPTCVRGFLNRESLNKILEADVVEDPAEVIGHSHDRVSRHYIIPDMNFSQSGTLKKWTFAGMFNISSIDLIEFQVWRRNDSGYHLVNETSVEPRPTGYLNVYEVVLPESPPVVVEAGDVVGVYLPEEDQSRYTLAYVEDSEGYEFMELDGDTGDLIAANCATSTCRGRLLVIADIVQHGGGTVAQFTTEATSGGAGGDRGMKFVPVVVAIVIPLLLLMAIISVVIVITIVVYWKRRTVKNDCTYVDTPTDKNPAYEIQGVYGTSVIDVSPTGGFTQNQATSDVYSNNPDDCDHEYDYVESIKEVTNKPKSEISMTSNTCYGNHERFYPSTDTNYRQNQYDNDSDYMYI